MSDPIKQLMKDMLDVKRRLARLEAQDTSETETWTSWTPELIGATSAGTYTYDIREGWYYRIDDIVFILCRFRVSGITLAGTGNARVTGLPYSNTGDVVAQLATSSNANLTAGYSALNGEVPLNLAFISLSEQGDDVRQAYNVAGVAVNDLFLFSGFYRASV